ncbi:hypothetical protein PNOK_0827700 [Pyrrhoderma noxium]|uniref:Uncharacterized protein n=1 Tax=Pyrrhoderma noxium TaxID=2282107 RepID=A0A286UAR7_9AGAM|nr:hypothetical protein PNOK_0827700 [Pyrrhoderma noxium]
MIIYYIAFASVVTINRTIILVTDSEDDLGTVFRVCTPYFDKTLIPKLITEGIMLVLALHIAYFTSSLYNVFSLYLFTRLFWSLANPKLISLPAPISLALTSDLIQYLLINIRIQASKWERVETDVSLEAIQTQ